MKTMLATLMLCILFTTIVQAERGVTCLPNAASNEREPFYHDVSSEKMREFVFPHDEETLYVYDGYIALGYSPLNSYKGVMNYNAQKLRDEVRLNRNLEQ